MIIAGITIFVATTALSAVLTSLAIRLAPRLGLVDRPDLRRKMHKTATSLGGGVAIYLATTIVLSTIAIMVGPYQVAAWSNLPICVGLILAGGLIVIVGLIDDRYRLRGREKLLGQIAASMVLIASGLLIENVSAFGWTIELGMLAIPFTLFWFLGAINALNLLDGIDGLASSIGAILVTAIAVMAALMGRPFVATFAMAFAGALIGFLRFNAPPAKIFLGDAGSMLIGLWIGALAILGALKGPGTMLLAAPLAIFTIPIFDAASAILRRKLSGRSIYTTDRGHIHHRLFERLGSTKSVLLFITAACAVTSIGALVSLYQKSDLLALVSCVTVVMMFIATGAFGSIELALLSRQLRKLVGYVFRGGGGRTSQKTNATFHLQGSREWEPLWAELLEQLSPFTLSGVRLDINCPSLHEEFLANWSDPARRDDRRQCWTLELPLTLRSEVVGTLEFYSQPNGRTSREQVDDVMEIAEIFQHRARFVLEGEEAERAVGSSRRMDPTASDGNHHQTVPTAKRYATASEK